MAREKRKDYEVAEVETDVYVCDFCDDEYEDFEDIRVFGVNPQLVFDHRQTDENLVWLNKDEGKRAVGESVSIRSDKQGHICNECSDEHLTEDDGPVSDTLSVTQSIMCALRDIMSP